MQYKNLPESTGTGHQPTMACLNESCPMEGETFSADRGDYFMVPGNEEVICSECSEPMFLVRMTWALVPA